MSRHNDFSNQLERELTENILPFWMNYPRDKINGGFYGAISNDLRIHNDVPRSAILCARILWTFSAAYRKFGDKAYLSTAEYAYAYLTTVFWDSEYGGLYWSVDAQGIPVLNRKHHYAQAFGIYGLTEYYQVTNNTQSLEFAQNLFHILEQYAFDPVYGGYIEGSSRAWETLEDMRLSTKEINCRKSMNSMLHILEAYTNLLRVWDHPPLKKQHRALIEIFLDRIIDPQEHHFKLFFNDAWDSLMPHISYGHDIEGSWLLVEAAEVQGDLQLLKQIQEATLQMAEVVYHRGRDVDGSIFYEGYARSVSDASKAWWVQAEAMVGFYNAYQLSGETHFWQAVQQCWAYIQTHLVDPTHGDWYKERLPDGSINQAIYKAGPWECPYHHSRACLELIERLT